MMASRSLSCNTLLLRWICLPHLDHALSLLARPGQGAYVKATPVCIPWPPDPKVVALMPVLPVCFNFYQLVSIFEHTTKFTHFYAILYHTVRAIPSRKIHDLRVVSPRGEVGNTASSHSRGRRG